MKRKFSMIIFLGILLAACQASPQRQAAATSLPTVVPVQPAAVQPTAAQISAPTGTPQPTQAPAADPALQAARAYAAALQDGDPSAAAGLLSNFSLMTANLTRGEAASQLQTRLANETFSVFQLEDPLPLDGRTTLVHAVYQLETSDVKTGEKTRSKVDEWWPLRQENGVWRYNYANLVDFVTLDVSEQTTAGLTLKPLRMTRYSDRIRLTFMAQNRTNDLIILGQTNEILAVFFFRGTRIEAEPTRLVFEPLRSYPDASLDVKGQFEAYPERVVIRQWKDYQVAPWFTFQMNW
jgi:hypothetical protein